MHKIVISGVGVNSPLGSMPEEIWESLNIRKHGFEDIKSLEGVSYRKGGVAKDVELKLLKKRKLGKMVNRKDVMAMLAAQKAIADANISSENPERSGIYVGACSTQLGDFMPYFETMLDCVSEDQKHFSSQIFGSVFKEKINPLAALKVLMNSSLAYLSNLYDIRGPNANFMDFEVSGSAALMAATEAIKEGAIDWALVGAMAEPFDPFKMNEFYARGWTKTQNTPIAIMRQEDQGTIFSECAVFFVVESEENFARRNAQKKYGNIVSIKSGYSSDNINESVSSSLGQVFDELPIDLILSNCDGVYDLDIQEMSAIHKLLREKSSDSPIYTTHDLVGNVGEASGLWHLLVASLIASKKVLPQPPQPAHSSGYDVIAVTNRSFTGASYSILFSK